MKFPLVKRSRLADCIAAKEKNKKTQRKLRHKNLIDKKIISSLIEPFANEEKLAKELFAASNLQFFGLRGCMRSGTNWLDSLLSRHPEIECHGEFHFQRLVGPWQENLAYIQGRHSHFQSTSQLLSHPYEPALKLAIAKQIRNEETRFVGDRTPWSIHPLTIRDSKYISLVRDGRDVLVSMAFHFLNVIDDELKAAHGWTVSERFPKLARHRPAFGEDRQYFKAFPHHLLEDCDFLTFGAEMWSQIVVSDYKQSQGSGSGNIRLIRYEDLHGDPVGISNDLFVFLGADPEKAPLPEGQQKPGFKESPGSFFRHGQVGDWQIYFSDLANRQFCEIAYEGLELFRYV